MFAFRASDINTEPGIDFCIEENGDLCLGGWGMGLNKVRVDPGVVGDLPEFPDTLAAKPLAGSRCHPVLQPLSRRAAFHPVAHSMSYRTAADGTVTLLPSWAKSEGASDEVLVFIRLCASFTPGLFFIESTKRRALRLDIDTSQVKVLDQNKGVEEGTTEEVILLVVMGPGAEVHLSTSLSPAKRNWFTTLCFGRSRETLLERRCLRYDGTNVSMSKPSWLSPDGRDSETFSKFVFNLPKSDSSGRMTKV